MSSTSEQTYLILLDIRSALNVGSLFRTADAAGVNKLFLVGTTPSPVDRFGRARADIKKTALGAEKSIAWEYKKDIHSLLRALKKQGIATYAIEQAPGSLDYKSVRVKKRAAFILGNEVNGIAESVLRKVDCVLSIPQKGKKESLNVAVAGGIALFRILNI